MSPSMLTHSVSSVAAVIRTTGGGHDWSRKWWDFMLQKLKKKKRLIDWLIDNVPVCLLRRPGPAWWDGRRGHGEVSNLSGRPVRRRARHARQLLPRLLPQLPPHMGRGEAPRWLQHASICDWKQNNFSWILGMHDIYRPIWGGNYVIFIGLIRTFFR